MVRLREIPRSAAFAWSPGSSLPLIATGTKAGAVDADFSTDTQLELWDLDFGTVRHAGELQPIVSVDTDSRFHDIAWGKTSSDHGAGILAGALENGSLDLWDAKALMSGESKSALSRTSKHSGAIKSLQFNPFRSELLATAGAKGELFISDLNNVANPFRLGTTSAARADDFESVDWNKKVPHILATGSSGGFVTVWDVKAKKESLTLNVLGRKAVSAVAWDPQNSTKLITAISDDSNPLILMWDLRNSNAPERTLNAHEQGVLSLSWCPQDPELLLSCGKDNRLICWNPSTGQAYGEFPIVTNWTFQTRWNPHNPSLLATAAFDGKIGIQTIQNTKPTEIQSPGAKKQPVDDEDFFNNAQSQPQGAAFSLPKSPKWLERPVGASFGFGGKLVSFRPAEGGSRRSQVRITHFAIDSNVGIASESFEAALKQGDYRSICDSKIGAARTDEEKADWKVMQTLIAGDPRKELVLYLGVSSETDDMSSTMATLDVDEAGDAAPSSLRPNGTKESKGHQHRLSAFFENPSGAGDTDNFLSGLSAGKGAKTNNPFAIYSGSESGSDKQITRALTLGQFEKALEICLREDRMSDAFMIAICGGQHCIDKAQKAYFAQSGKGPHHLRLLAAIVGKNLWDVVYNADLANWRAVMATLCTFAEPTEFPDLCEALGDRLEEEMRHDGSQTELRKDASFCYLAGSKLEKVVPIWIEELHESEKQGLDSPSADSSFSVHAKSLQNLIEKVTVFRAVTRFEDTEQKQTSGWKLTALYDKYTEYADIVAAHGQLQVAEKYLDLLPPHYAAAEVARNRVKQASRKVQPQSQAQNQGGRATIGRAAQPARPQASSMMGGMGGMSSQPQASYTAPAVAAAATNPYAPAGISQPSNPYAPSNLPLQPMGGYASGGYQQGGYQAGSQPGQVRSAFIPPPPVLGGYSPSGPSAGLGAPPRGSNASPSVPPPSRATTMENWNDTPMVVKPPTSRRATPSIIGQPITSPFPNQVNFSPGPPPSMPYGVQARATPPPPPPPPPPKAGSGPPSSSIPPRQYSVSGPGGVGMSAPQESPRLPSTAANAYAPPQLAQTSVAAPPPTIPRGPSPYNAPPSGAPPSNRYAPAPAASGYAPPDASPSMASPGRGLPPPTQSFGGQPRRQNAYAPPQPQPQPQPQQASNQGPMSSNRVPQGGSRPGSVQSSGRVATPVAVAAAAPPKHPAGDRTHIAALAQPIYDVLNGEMQRVKAKAPTSFRAQVIDTEKRLNILFDHLNNNDLLKPDTVESMCELAQALHQRNYEVAQVVQMEILMGKTDECGQWMVGVKRLIPMSRATP